MTACREWAAQPAVPPQVTSITPTTGPDGGYFALSVLGVPPVAGVGDDTITNFNVPTFYYGGEPYTRIGVVSNGYVVVGGGDSGDIVFTPQHFPVAARPNNTVAPLWTDLNPPGGGAIRVASLSGGTNDGWVVVDWDGVKNFGNATTHSFEVWFRIQKGTSTGPASEAITLSYGPNLAFPGDGPGLGNAGSGDPDSGVNWGAENRDGSSGLNIASAPANGSEYPVTPHPAHRGRYGIDPVHPVGPARRALPLDREHDVQRDAGNHPGGPAHHCHAVAPLRQQREGSAHSEASCSHAAIGSQTFG